MKKIVFIPLDDRPVCVDRIILQASSAGFEVILPPRDLYSTKLEKQPLNKNGTQHGDIDGLSSWLEKNIRDDIEAYIISVDQILSGGLVNSRAVIDCNIEKECEIIDKFFGDKGLLKGKKNYLFDTIMRLAPTVRYKNYKDEDYVNMRAFGKISRLELEGNDLCLENIFDSYDRGLDNKEIVLLDGIHLNQKKDYYASRKRKLCLSDDLLDRVKKLESTYYIAGIDDSSDNITIQTNEIKYLTKKLEEFGNVIIGTDELASMLVTRFSVDYYRFIPKVKLTFIGNQIDVKADAYDNGTLRVNIKNHLNFMKIEVDNLHYEVEVVIMTKASEQFTLEENVKNTIRKVKENIHLEIPTILVDCSTWDFYGELEKSLAKENFLGGLLGYSNWNTVANAVGLSLGQGLTRFIFLNQENISDELNYDASKSFIKLLCISYFKDMGYKIGCNEMVNQYIYENALNEFGQTEKNSFMNFYQYIKYSNTDFLEGLHHFMNCDENPCNVKLLTKNICGSKFLSKYHKDKHLREYYVVNNIENIKFLYTWFRHFEINIDLNVLIEKG